MLKYLHYIFLLYLALYPYLIFQNNIFDTFYVFLFILGKLSWIFCKDECIISYLFKIVENPKYKLGDNFNELQDTNKKHKNKYAQLSIILFPFLYATNIILINLRSHIIPTIWMNIIIEFYFVYLYYIHSLKKHNNINPQLVLCFKMVYTIILGYIIYEYTKTIFV